MEHCDFFSKEAINSSLKNLAITLNIPYRKLMLLCRLAVTGTTVMWHSNFIHRPSNHPEYCINRYPYPACNPTFLHNCKELQLDGRNAWKWFRMMDSKWIVLLVNMVFESLHDNIVLSPGYCPAHTQGPRWAAITVTLNWHWYSVDYQTRLENFMMQCKPVSSLSMIRLARTF